MNRSNYYLFLMLWSHLILRKVKLIKPHKFSLTISINLVITSANRNFPHKNESKESYEDPLMHYSIIFCSLRKTSPSMRHLSIPSTGNSTYLKGNGSKKGNYWHSDIIYNSSDFFHSPFLPHWHHTRALWMWATRTWHLFSIFGENIFHTMSHAS